MMINDTHKDRAPSRLLPHIPYNYCAHGIDIRLTCQTCLGLRVNGLNR